MTSETTMMNVGANMLIHGDHPMGHICVDIYGF